MLIASRDGVRVDAQSAERRVPYHCPGCDCPVVLKRGAVITAHFAHQAKSSCGYASRETEAHRSAKLAIFQAFRESGLRAELEHYVPSLAGAADRRADVMIWLPSGQRVAIEVQHSPISMDDLHRRSASYAAMGIAFCWIPVISDKILKPARVEDGDMVVRRYPAPDWQRWINGVGFGRMWIMTTDLRLWDARLKPSVVTLPGGREKVLSAVKDLHLVPISLAGMKLQVEYRRKPFSGGEHRYPAGLIGRITARRLPIARPAITTYPYATSNPLEYR
jgi:hypothetical protein